jgi:hypothetical protein
MDEFFEVTFRYFRALLSLDEQKCVYPDVLKYVHSDSLSSFSNRFCLVGDVYGNSKLLILNLLEHLLTRNHSFFEFIGIHYESYLAYLSQQGSHVNLKFKELLLEVVGEYSKLLLKAKEMEETSNIGYYKKLTRTVFDNLWRRFHFTLSSRLRKLSSKFTDENRVLMLGFEECNNELSSMIKSNTELKKIFYHPSSELLSLLPLLMMKFSFSEKKNSHSPIMFMAETKDDLLELFSKIESFYTSAATVPTVLEVPTVSVVRIPAHFKNLGYIVDTILWSSIVSYYYRTVVSVDRSISIDYLSLVYHVQHSTVLYNDYLYLCLEEFVHSPQVHDTASVFHLLDYLKVRILDDCCAIYVLILGCLRQGQFL